MAFSSDTTARARRDEDRMRLTALFMQTVRNPQPLLAVWNWKSALLSITLRGPIFFAASISHGLSAAFSALLVETLVCAFGVGLYNALVQTLRKAEPLWATGLLLSVVFPGCVQAIEYTMHRLRGTPHLRVAAMVSLGVSGISTLFNWYAMRRGSLMVGRNSSGLLSDLRSLPRLIAGFVAEPFRYLLRCLTPKMSGGIEPAGEGQTRCETIAPSSVPYSEF